MAIDLFSDSPPRISFSHDVCLTEVVPIEQDQARSYSSDFDFCVSDRYELHETSSADELFSGGVILPIQIKERKIRSKHSSQSSLPPLPCPATVNECVKREIVESDERKEAKSFWRFNRSSSLNCDNTYRKGLIWSLPLLSRSYSTGSAPNSKRSQVGKDSQKQISQKQRSKSSSTSSLSSSSSSNFYSYPVKQRPNLMHSYGNGVQISPVLNVPPPYISKGTANMFGLGSFFRNGKDKSKKK